MVMYMTPFDIPTFTFLEMDPYVHRKSKPTVTELSPAVRTYQNHEKQTILELDLPGVAKEHVSVEVDGHKLTVTGKRFRFDDRPAEQTDKQDGSDGNAVEHKSFAVYKRTFTLARSVDVTAVKAQSFENGVLSLVLPKKQQEQPRRIQLE